MSLIGNRDGYYDDEGAWHRTKHCFVSCGNRCTCRPPGGLHYSVEHDQRITAKCADCKKPIIRHDDEALVCINCGGRNRQCGTEAFLARKEI